jgi:hypothetical protein
MSFVHKYGKEPAGCQVPTALSTLVSFSVCSTVLAVGVDVDAEMLASCRAASSPEAGAQAGVIAMPQLFVGRFEAPLLVRMMEAWKLGAGDTALALNAQYLASRETAELRAYPDCMTCRVLVVVR